MSVRRLATSAIVLACLVIPFITAVPGCTKVQEIPAKDERIEISSISLSQNSAEMLVGETVTLVATVLPPDATDKDKLIWSSSKQSVATVTDKGVVKAISPGASTIMVSAGGRSATCNVTVTAKVVPVTGVSVNPAKLEITEGETATLTASIMPEDASNKNIRWSSDNEEVVKVSDSGVLTAVSAGKATVTAVTEDGAKTAACAVTVVARTIAVESVSISLDSLLLVVGDKATLSVEVSPQDASDKTVVWSSSDEGIVVVKDDGSVEAISAGEATITATASGTDKADSCMVIISEKAVPVEGVSVKPVSLGLVEGESSTLVAIVTPETATNKKVVWSSDNEDIVTVSEEGLVEAVATGKATVTVTTEDGGKKAACVVTVTSKPIAVTGISISSESLTIEKGQTKYLTATIEPEDATNKKVTWSTSNKSVVSVTSYGAVTAVSPGTARITATSQDGNFTASCTVTVPAAVSFSGLTLEAINAGTITIDSDPMNLTIEYSKDGVNWTSETGNQIYISLSSGDKLYLRGNNSAYGKIINGLGYCTTIDCTSPFYAYGNVMSLIDSNNYESLKSFSEDRALVGLFQNSTNLRSHPSKDLELPATGLTASCYSGMFYGCSGLTRAPELPATKLADYCYSGMFQDCTSLTGTPVLPATTLADFCYNYMFTDCTSLTKASALPASQMQTGCYRYMFYGCSSLTSAPMLPAQEIAPSCYEAMFGECSSLVNAPGLPAAVLEENCYRAMFYQCTSLKSTSLMKATKAARNSCRIMYRGCSSLTSSNDLPATELADSCYRAMFIDCTSLRNAPSLPATKLADHCYQSMFSGCSSLTGAPSLPATQLAGHCYYLMFRDCSSLVNAPLLPAENLADYCYYGMFYGCSSLRVVERLPARTLANSCYFYMFQGCTSLVDAPQIMATTLAEYCCASMFRNCTSLKTAPTLYATTLVKRCYGAMFQGCTALVTPPELPATSLPEGCYASMFKECSSLKESPVIPATTWTKDCCYSMFAACSSLSKMTVYYPINDNVYTEDWVKGVASSGTFYVKSGAEIAYGSYAIPSGWNVVEL